MDAYSTGRFAAVDRSRIESVTDLQGLVAVLEAVKADFVGDRESEWENPTLARFLDALAAYAADLPGLYGNRGEPLPDQPTWRMIAELIVGATGYE